MYSLFIDTHDKNVLIILFKDGKIIEKEDIVSENKHSEITMPVIEKVLGNNNVDVKDLNNIIVVNGPGSFTGERIAVTIGKTMAYCLNIPIRVIDSLSIKAININGSSKFVSLEDRNGAFVGEFNSNNEVINMSYMNKSNYLEFKETHNVIVDVDIDYELVYNFIMKKEPINAHEVKPLYIKGISALNGR